MDYVIGLFEKTFDFYFISLIILGNTFVFDLGLYPKSIIEKSKGKVYLAAFNSLVFGVAYYYINIVTNSVVDLKTMVNSYFLATSLWEFGIKEVISYLKQNLASIVINKIKSNTSGDSNPPAQGQ